MDFEQLKQGKTCRWIDDVTICLISQDDLSDIFTMLEDPAVAKYLFFAPAPEEFYRGFFEPIVKDTQRAIGEGGWPETPTFVLRDQKGKYMGMCALTRAMFLEGNFEVGYQLPQHSWGKGLATAACGLLTKLAFSELGAHKVAADCYATNIGSYRTLEKNGYKLEGRQEAYYRDESEYTDKLLYGLTIAQYES